MADSQSKGTRALSDALCASVGRVSFCAYARIFHRAVLRLLSRRGASGVLLRCVVKCSLHRPPPAARITTAAGEHRSICGGAVVMLSVGLSLRPSVGVLWASVAALQRWARVDPARPDLPISAHSLTPRRPSPQGQTWRTIRPTTHPHAALPPPLSRQASPTIRDILPSVHMNTPRIYSIYIIIYSYDYITHMITFNLSLALLFIE